jgi:hypothetical protein
MNSDPNITEQTKCDQADDPGSDKTIELKTQSDFLNMKIIMEVLQDISPGFEVPEQFKSPFHDLIHTPIQRFMGGTAETALEQIIVFRDNFVDLPIVKGTGKIVDHLNLSGSHKLKYQKPYGIDEIDAFETKNGIELPEEFKTYLTEVSRSLYKDHLEFSIIELIDDDKMSKPCALESDYAFDDDPDITECMGMMRVRRIGCGYNHMICLNGKYRGAVWEEAFVGDGPIVIIADNFFEYAMML